MLHFFLLLLVIVPSWIRVPDPDPPQDPHVFRPPGSGSGSFPFGVLQSGGGFQDQSIDHLSILAPQHSIEQSMKPFLFVHFLKTN